MKFTTPRAAALLIASAMFAAFIFAVSPTATAETGYNTEYYDLIVLGIDRRPHQKSGRSDVMMIVHCEPGRITLFSIPRDTITQVGRKRDKINHAWAFGGLRLSKASIEHLLKFKIDNYIAVDFETFVKTIDVIKAMTDNGRLIGAENFLANANALLTWLRWRNLPAGDRRRCQRQQLFIIRVMEYTMDLHKNNPALFEQCVKAGLKVVDSDLTFEHLDKLYKYYENINFDRDIERYVLPGKGKTYYRTDQKTGKRKVKGWYYYPLYDWSLGTYINWYRANGISMNYKELDSLRK